MENQFKGTQGKWEFNEDNILRPEVMSNHEHICLVANKTDKWLYNGKLISKAPEMLEMLKSVFDLQKENYGNGMKTHLALIKKAKEIEQLIKEATNI